MKRTAILNVVGLSPRLIGPHTPRLSAYRDRGSHAIIRPAFPAVTCTAQSDYLTGSTPAAHGIVGNGWYDRTLAEVQFWKQSNHLVHGEKLWETLRRRHPGATCAKLFWWYNMYSSADFSITPRPMYPADGRKVFDVYTWPYELRTGVKQALGDFPFPGFWGPAAGVDSPQGRADAASRWIAASARWVEERHRPTLSLVYLPHLDYNLQRHGPRASSTPGAALNPRIERDLHEIDTLVGELLDFYAARDVQVLVLSEYGITQAEMPVHLNRCLREAGWLVVKEELGLELLDAGASQAFAVADHQVAHVYVRDPAHVPRVRQLLESTPGVAEVLDVEAQRARGLAHARSGDLVVVAHENAWFTYYYWLEDAKAPDFARCVDIHRKPGYDPVELFTDPRLSTLALRTGIAWRLLKKKLGFRMLMDLIPLDATLVRGSHGAQPRDRADWPVLLGPSGSSLPAETTSTGVRDILLERLCG